MFLWYYYEAGNTPNLYKDSSPVENTDISGCATGSCGGVGFATRSSSLSIPDIQDGKEYYFQVHISQNDAPENYHDVIINSTRTYKIKVTTDLNSSIGLTIGLVTGGVMVLVVVVSTVVILKCRMERNRAKKRHRTNAF
ncbi:uncharacterized protein LOC123528264 [Mercenaria mercenaria]|uniref:uncharacterized protein LOC123528264 n=1 Tax=Mercenaria mercenaria TaxID=6596 RepID=UPI00234F8E1D|nr:uncharacterized protein LOC123528264 [Mercenaria mercenaria]